MAKDDTQRRSFRGFGTIVEEARTRRAMKTKQPWFVLKMTIGLAAAVIVYVCYVYIGRLCVPMIKRDVNALGGRAMGVAFMVVFILLGFMMIWSYIKVVLTPPGFAVNYVDKVRAFDSPSPRGPEPAAPPRTRTRKEDPSGLRFDETLGIPMPAPKKHPKRSDSSHSSPPTTSEGPDGVEMHAQFPSPPPTPPLPQPRSGAEKPPTPRPAQAPVAVENRLTRQPPTLPMLRPEYRYCRRCQIVKPPRTHHCKSCGTCVMKFDHHCPWIGQCVGAQNHKFFMVFNFWTAWFCLWTLSTLIGLNARPHANRSIDGQQIAVIALAGLFALFTVTMCITHAALISMNQSTVENMSQRGMKERENFILAELHPWWAVGAKRRTKKQWDAEWGRIGFEGNIWWLGSVRAHFEQVLGPSPWTWFLPIGRSPMDGLHYERNPRFDRDGRWLPRKAWPKELQ
ncbi:zf-DHHC-domain-containing protein [Artomyces pyxidatus]|uniref:Zf-DHHC-domain-containing protein n=1 Tax=Artomyces pyxidatus TaxID=48021 RepID=A0ACB8T2M3_9AGAM|nr:zf-DHHC-domain-containing protein [Artomyces pyxidatus]